jgi:hypothetical protein
MSEEIQKELIIEEISIQKEEKEELIIEEIKSIKKEEKHVKSTVYKKKTERLNWKSYYSADKEIPKYVQEKQLKQIGCEFGRSS